MADVVYQMLNVDVFTLSVIAALCGWATILIAIVTGSNLFSSFFVPTMALGAFGILFAARELGITILTDRDSNIIVTAGLGVILGFLLAVLLLRLFYMFVDRGPAVRNANEIGQERHM